MQAAAGPVLILLETLCRGLAWRLEMSTSIYLINPASDFPTYFSAEVFAGRGLGAAAFMADLSIATLAGMFPEDFHVKLCDENISAVDFNHPADYIGITGEVTQRNRMAPISAGFRPPG